MAAAGKRARSAPEFLSALTSEPFDALQQVHGQDSSSAQGGIDSGNANGFILGETGCKALHAASLGDEVQFT